MKTRASFEKVNRTDIPNVALVIDDIVSYPATNGVVDRFTQVAKHLSGDANIHVVIADRGGSDISSLEEGGISATIVPSRWLYDDDKYPEVLQVLREKKIDIIHVANAHTMVPVYGFKLANSLGAKLICDMHDLYSDLAQNDTAAQAEDAAQQTIANHCDHIIVMSKLDYDRLDKIIDKDRLSWIPNGIQSRPPRENFPESGNVLFVGNMHYPPNAEAAELIKREIAPAVRAAHPQAQFDMVGQSTDALTADPQDGVKFWGRQPSLAPFFQRAGCAVAPLLRGGGMKVKMLHYAVHGLPIVCTPIAMMGYESNPGFFVSSNTAGLVRDAIELLDKSQKAAERGEDARRYVASNFSWDRLIPKLRGVYQQVHRQPKREAQIDYKREPEGMKLDNVLLTRPSHLEEERYKRGRQLPGILSIKSRTAVAKSDLHKKMRPACG